MKTYLQIEKALSELKRGEMIVVFDSETHSAILLSAAELINEKNFK